MYKYIYIYVHMHIYIYISGISPLRYGMKYGLYVDDTPQGSPPTDRPLLTLSRALAQQQRDPETTNVARACRCTRNVDR